MAELVKATGGEGDPVCSRGDVGHDGGWGTQAVVRSGRWKPTTGREGQSMMAVDGKEDLALDDGGRRTGRRLHGSRVAEMAMASCRRWGTARAG